MNLLNNVFEAYEAHDFRLLDSYLHLILAQFLRKFARPPGPSEALAAHFTLFEPSQSTTVKNTADFFDMLYRSEDDKPEPRLRDDDTKLTLVSRDLSPQGAGRSHPDNSLASQLKEKPEWLKALGKVFPVLDSKAIKKLLLLLEHPKESTRKLVMLLFQVLLRKTQSKVHFVEKCAIGFSPGVYLVSRMKYVHQRVPDSGSVFRCLAALRKFFRLAQSALELGGQRMHGGA